jgi:SNF2 family DNA or RNA helicase
LCSAEEIERSDISSNKFEFLIEKLKTLVSANHKAIVFSQFTSLLKLFRKVLDEVEIPYEYLDGQSQNRMEIVTRFQESQEIPILLAGIKTGGLGLNLTAADYCFILDPWWNPAIEQQAVDRIHRIGQEKIVNIYRIVSQNTVEEKMLQLKETKQKIADQLLTADHSFLEKLNYEDFQFFFQ